MTNSYILNEKAFSKELVGHDVIPSETNDATKVATTYDSGVTLRDVINKDVLPEYHEMLDNEVVDIRWIKSNNNQETAVLTFIKGGACVIGYDNNDYPFISEIRSDDSPIIDLDVLDNHIIYSKTFDITGEILEEYTRYIKDSFFTIKAPWHYQRISDHTDIIHDTSSGNKGTNRLMHDNNKLFAFDRTKQSSLKIIRYIPDTYAFSQIVELEDTDTLYNHSSEGPVPFVAGLNSKDVGFFTTIDSSPSFENDKTDIFFVIADDKNTISITRSRYAQRIQRAVQDGRAEVKTINDRERVASILMKHKIPHQETDQLIIIQTKIDGTIYEIPWIKINRIINDVYKTDELIIEDSVIIPLETNINFEKEIHTT